MANVKRLPLLIVEGKNDLHVVMHLLMRHGWWCHDQKFRPDKLGQPGQNEIVIRSILKEDDGESSGSREKVLGAISEYVRKPDETVFAIGFILDADSLTTTEWNLQKIWCSVRDRIRAATPLDMPVNPDPAGFVGNHPNPKVATRLGVWIMPDNTRDGALEDFVQSMIGSGTLFQHAEASTAAAKADHSAPFPDKDRRKAELAAWLAWQEKPGLPYGTAIKAQALTHNGPLATQFVNWVQELCGIAPASPTQ